MVKLVVKPRILFFVLVMSTLSSCGTKTNSPTVKPTGSPAFLTLTEANCQSSKTLDVYSDSVDFSNRLGTYISRYNQRVAEGYTKLERLDDKSAELYIKSSPLSPLILSEAALNTSLKNLEIKFKELIGKNNYDHLAGAQDAPFLTISLSKEKSALFNEMVGETRDLLTKSLRWQSLQCSLEELSRRKERDVRSYFVLEHEKKTSESETSINEAALNICNDFNRPVVCLSEQQILKRKNNIKGFNDHYEKLGLDKTSLFFKRHGTHQFLCKKEAGKTVLEIPYIADSVLVARLGKTFAQMETKISERWSNDRVQVRMKKVGIKADGVLDFKWQGGGLSFVDRAKPLTINLSEFLSRDILMLTINHELGHVLGFPDCYHEFYDKRKKEIVYYSLDKSSENLMCTMSINASIPNLYFDQLLESACSYN
jgi:hypothetical protein